MIKNYTINFTFESLEQAQIYLDNSENKKQSIIFFKVQGSEILYYADNTTNTIEEVSLGAGSGSSALFPNGIEFVNASRDFQLSDKGKILVMVDGVNLTMPEINPFSEGDNVLISTYTEASVGNSVTLVNGDNPTLLLAGEPFFLTNVDMEGTIFAITPASSNIGDKTILKYLYDQSQNAIPLSGTEIGKPVTGDIYFNDATSLVLNDGGGGVSFRVGYSGANTFLNFQTGSGLDYISVNSDGAGTSRGLVGGADYTANITDLDYTQKIYVGFRGTATLSSGTVTVLTDKVLTGYKIYLSVNTPSGTQGFISASTADIVDGTSFVINSSSALDNSTVNWWITP